MGTVPTPVNCWPRPRAVGLLGASGQRNGLFPPAGREAQTCREADGRPGGAGQAEDSPYPSGCSLLGPGSSRAVLGSAVTYSPC